jgi:sugar phosphate isomerase/epimerase
MKVGISMWSLVSAYNAGRMDVTSFIRFAASSGAEGVELLDYFWRDAVNEAPAARDLAHELHLAVSAYAIANDFVQPDTAVRGRELDRVREGVDMAVLLETPLLRVFSGSAKDGVSAADGDAWITEGLRAAAAYASQRGVTLVLENHGLFAGQSNQVRRLIERVDSPHLRANVDTGNFLLVNQDPVAAVRDLAPVTAYVHLKDLRQVNPDEDLAEAYAGLDGRRYIGTVLGSGSVALQAVLAALRDTGYDGWLSIEYEGTGNPEHEAALSLQWTRSTLHQIAAGATSNEIKE